MKITSKKEKIQLAILVGAVVIAAMYAGVRFGMKPMLAKRKTQGKKMVGLEKSGEKYRATLKNLPNTQKQYAAIVAEMAEISEKHMPLPIFGNYDIVIRQRAKAISEKALVRFENVRIAGRRDIPIQPGSKSERVFSLLYADLQLQCSFVELQCLLKAVEDVEPHAAVTDIRVESRPESPLWHTVTLTVAWPIWIKPDERPTVKPTPTGDTEEPGGQEPAQGATNDARQTTQP